MPNIPQDETPQVATSATPEEGPIPLRPEPLPMPTFPMDALGSLRKAAEACQQLGNIRDVVAAHSVLATATLATQGLADIEFPGGKPLPISCYFITIAGSGDGKTSGSSYAVAPIYQRQKQLEALRKAAMPTWRIRNARWRKQMNDLIKNTEADLSELGAEPQAPLLARLILADITYEGLYKLFRDGQPSLGMITSEGGHFIGSYGMLNDNMLRMICGLSTLWDGDALDRTRASEDSSCLYGRRLAIHLMLQPSVADILLSNPVVRGQGFLSRCLIVNPKSMAGERFCDTDPDPVLKLEIENFTHHMLEIMQIPFKTAESIPNELAPRCLHLTSSQKDVWRDYQHQVEKSRGEDGAYASITEFAAKIPNHILRLAGILTLVDNPMAEVIQDTALAGAIKLGHFYLEEALRLEMLRIGDPLIIKAERFQRWLHEKTLTEFEIRHAQRNSPIRDPKILSQVLTLLCEHRYLKHVRGTTYQVI